MCRITKSLRAILDPDNPEDKKILLLAELIEDMRDSITAREDKMQEDILSVKSQIAELTERSEGCPIIRDAKGEKTKFIRFVMEYPKVTIGIVLLIGLLIGISGPSIVDTVIKIITSF